MADADFTQNNKSDKRIIVDVLDENLLLDFAWKVSSKGYAVRYFTSEGIARRLWLHRVIAGAIKGQIVDHANGNTLDNRRCNLRICSHAENMRNRKMHKNNSCGLKGVYFDKSVGNRMFWRAQIRHGGKKIYLGRFQDAETAHSAYLMAAKKLHGDFARLP